MLLLLCLIGAYPQSQISGTFTTFVQNDSAVGTLPVSLAKINGFNHALTPNTSDTTLPTYIVVSGAGTGGSASIALAGQAACAMDTTIASGALNDFVVASTTTAGYCHPQSAMPTAGTWVVGYLMVGSTISGAASQVQVSGYISAGSGSGSVPTGAGQAPTTSGNLAFDTTQQQVVAGDNGITASATPAIVSCSAVPSADTLSAPTIGTTETAFATTCTIPANYLVAGKMLETLLSISDTTGSTAATFTLKGRFQKSGPTNSYFFQPAGLNQGASLTRSYLIQCLIGAQSIGSSATMTVACGPILNGSNTLPNTISTITMDTTSQQVIQWTITFSASTAGNSMQLLSQAVRIIN